MNRRMESRMMVNKDSWNTGWASELDWKIIFSDGKNEVEREKAILNADYGSSILLYN